ncbi:MAG: hypothetical protein HY813_02535 [Candidatus Portnoybacteria bacterium]|nr:hypothetical protein [Candidatus Portnoybacteria bacterium]
MNNFEKILVAAIILFVFAAGFVLFFQQKSIDKVENYIGKQQESSTADKAINQPAVANKQNARPKNQEQSVNTMKEDFIKNTKDIVGEITSISQRVIVVNAQVIDLAAIKDNYFSNHPKEMTTTKTYKVKFDGSTLFSSAKLPDLKIGDKIQAFSNKPILEVDEFLAKEITTNFRLEEEAQ